MNYPPAPVFSGDQRAALSVHQPGSVEQRNRDARNQEQHQQRMVFVAPRQCRPDAAPHQPQPESQSDEQQDLPEAPEIDVFVALRSQPEPQVAELLLDAHPFAGKRSDDNGDHRDEQYIHAKPLSFRFSAADCRNDVQAGRQPGGGDPENSDLQMPGARDRIGQPFRKRDSVEAAAFDTVVGDDRAQRDLDHPQRRHHEEVFDRGFLRRRGTQTEQRIASRHDTGGGFVILRSEVPDHAADGRQQQDKADDAPNHGAAGGTIANQLFMRPILCIGDILSGAIRARRPRRPPKERRHLVLLGDIGQRTGGDGVFVASLAIDVGVVSMPVPRRPPRGRCRARWCRSLDHMNCAG